jgi:hypothetical protein
MLYNTEEIGIRVYRTPSFLATMASERVGRWHRWRCYMVVGAKPHCFGPDKLQEDEKQLRMLGDNLRIV